MTRFARAKGSKASNERLPEQATPWSQMKEDLLNKRKEIEESKKREKANNQRNANYKAFLVEREQENANKMEWAKFPEAETIKNKNKSKTNSFKQEESEEDEGFAELKAKIDIILDGKQTDNDHNSESDSPPEEKSAKEQPQKQVVKKAKSPKKKLLKIVVAREESQQNKKGVSQKQCKEPDESVDNIVDMNTDKKQKKKKNKRKKEGDQTTSEVLVQSKKAKKEITENGEVTNINKNTSELTDEEKELKRKEKLKKRYEKRKEKTKQRKLEARLKRESQSEESGKPVKSHQSNIKKHPKKKDNTETKIVNKAKEDLTQEELQKLQKKKERRVRQLEKKKLLKPVKADSEHQSYKHGDPQNINGDDKEIEKKTVEYSLPKNSFTKNNNETLKPQKLGKVRDNKEHHPKKLRPHTMFINGKTIEIDYVDGFPVKKEDAERLKKLRKEMVAKGLPRSEINIALKLERRKAEKAFAREKKNVCFNCRKSGHNLSECPELGKNQVADSAGTGICFKCGSTEHTHFECKVVRGMEYKFAQCFVCNEQGHIARQCPDNARGLYPKGGACKVCGDVTHLKKDCPKYQAQQEQLQNNIHLNTLDDQNPDVLDSKERSRGFSGINMKSNKIIKF